jgi:hypothetical protein
MLVVFFILCQLVLEVNVLLFQVLYQGFHFHEFGSEDITVSSLLLVLLEGALHQFQLRLCLKAVLAFFERSVEVYVVVCYPAAPHPTLLPVLLLQLAEVLGYFLHSPFDGEVNPRPMGLKFLFEIDAPLASELPLNVEGDAWQWSHADCVRLNALDERIIELPVFLHVFPRLRQLQDGELVRLPQHLHLLPQARQF